jgi:hypothetical protein
MNASTLKRRNHFFNILLRWLYLLPAEAKNTTSAIITLAQIHIDKRFHRSYTADTPIEANIALKIIALHQTWTSAEQEVLRAFLLSRGIIPRPGIFFEYARPGLI